MSLFKYLSKTIVLNLWIIIASISYPSYAEQSGGATTSGEAALTVQTIKPKQGVVQESITASGNIAPWQEIVVGSQSNGLRLMELKANVGDWVKKGQELAVFAEEGAKADVLQAQANFLEAQAHAEDAQLNATNARSIANTGAFSTQQINQFITAAKAAQARVKATQAILDNAKLRQSYTHVVAPEEGVISTRTATIGAVVPAGAELFRMVQQGRLEWQAELTESNISRVKVGEAARVTLSSGSVIEGTVSRISPTLNMQKRTAIVYVDLPKASEQGAKAGMFTSGVIVLGSGNGWLVPQSAVIVRDGFQYVFVVDENHKVHQRKVQVGVRQGDMLQIVQGVNGNSLLVASGVGFLNDGDTVQVVDKP